MRRHRLFWFLLLVCGFLFVLPTIWSWNNPHVDGPRFYGWPLVYNQMGGFTPYPRHDHFSILNLALDIAFLLGFPLLISLTHRYLTRNNTRIIYRSAAITLSSLILLHLWTWPVLAKILTRFPHLRLSWSAGSIIFLVLLLLFLGFGILSLWLGVRETLVHRHHRASLLRAIMATLLSSSFLLYFCVLLVWLT